MAGYGAIHHNPDEFENSLIDEMEYLWSVYYMADDHLEGLEVKQRPHIVALLSDLYNVPKQRVVSEKKGVSTEALVDGLRDESLARLCVLSRQYRDHKKAHGGRVQYEYTDAVDMKLLRHPGMGPTTKCKRRLVRFARRVEREREETRMRKRRKHNPDYKQCRVRNKHGVMQTVYKKRKT